MSPSASRPPLDPRALALVLALAAALRLWGIEYGLPWLFYFHDEPQVVLRALRFGTGDLNPHFFLWPAILLLYLAFASYGGLFVAGRLLGWWEGREGFAAAYFSDPSVFYLLPRLQTAAVGTWGVWLAARLGAAAYSAPVGVAAALGLALNALHSHYAHFVHPVTWMTSFTLLGLWAAVRIAGDGGRRDLAVAALALGLGIACQYHAALLVAPLGAAVLIRGAREGRRVAWLARGAAVVAAGVLLFLVLSPYTVLDFATFRSDLAWIAAKTEGSLYGVSRGWWAGFDGFVRTCVVPALGAPLAVAALLGALAALARRGPADLVLLAFVLPYLVAGARAASLNDRYATPLVVPALLFAARLVESVLAGARFESRARWAVPLAIVLLGAPVAVRLVEDDVTMRRADTRIEALRWFESHVPPDARVSLDMLRFWNTATAPLGENRARLEERLAETTGALSGAGHSNAYADYYRFRLAHPRTPGYYLRSTEMGTAAPPLDRLRRDGYGWAIVSGEVADQWRAREAPADSGGAAYYRGLEREATLVAEFLPEPWVRRGPPIRVYRLEPDSAAGPAGPPPAAP